MKEKGKDSIVHGIEYRASQEKREKEQAARAEKEEQFRAEQEKKRLEKQALIDEEKEALALSSEYKIALTNIKSKLPLLRGYFSRLTWGSIRSDGFGYSLSVRNPRYGTLVIEATMYRPHEITLSVYCDPQWHTEGEMVRTYKRPLLGVNMLHTDRGSSNKDDVLAWQIEQDIWKAIEKWIKGEKGDRWVL